MSGVLYKFVILTKLPNSKLVTPALIDAKSLPAFHGPQTCRAVRPDQIRALNTQHPWGEQEPRQI